MATPRRITLFIGLQIAAIVLAIYLGYARTVPIGTESPVFKVIQRFLPQLGKAPIPTSPQGPSNDVSDLQNSFEADRFQIPCGYVIALETHHSQPKTLDRAAVVPLPTVLDPLSNDSTIAKSLVLNDRLLKILYEEAGNSRVIPEGSLYLRMGSLTATLPSPELVVIDDDDINTKQSGNQFQLRLGRSFLRDNEGRIDLDEMELYVTAGGQTNVMIPFLRPRSSMAEILDEGRTTAPTAGEGEL